MTTPKMIDLALKPLIEDKDVKVSNLYTKILNIKDFENPNEVKVVIDNNKCNLFFKRTYSFS